MDLTFNKNEDHNKLLLSELKQRLAKVKLGGGEKRIEKLHAEGKMTARERIDYLLDDKAKSIEIKSQASESRGFWYHQILMIQGNNSLLFFVTPFPCTFY